MHTKFSKRHHSVHAVLFLPKPHHSCSPLNLLFRAFLLLQSCGSSRLIEIVCWGFAFQSRAWGWWKLDLMCLPCNISIIEVAVLAAAPSAHAASWHAFIVIGRAFYQDQEPTTIMFQAPFASQNYIIQHQLQDKILRFLVEIAWLAERRGLRSLQCLLESQCISYRICL